MSKAWSSRIVGAEAVGRDDLGAPPPAAGGDPGHHRQITTHLAQLAKVRGNIGEFESRLEAVLRAYAPIARHNHDTELGRFLHRDEHLAGTQRQLHDLITGLVSDAVQASDIREDIPPAELATYCSHALNAAASLPS